MKNKKIHLLWMLLFVLFFGMSEISAENNLIFNSEKIKFAGIEMPYRIAHINSDDSGIPILVIYLHGGSSKGNDNEMQMREAGIDSIANYLVSKQIKAIYLVPQCPIDKSWGGTMLSALKALVDKYKNNALINKNCIYIFGGSMGGTGTWSMLSAYPRLFAAAMPVAGDPSKCNADSVSLTPVFTVMGTEDRIMDIEITSNFIDELNTRHGNTKFETEEGWTHEMTCIQSYTTRRLDWIFAHNATSTSVKGNETYSPEIECVRFYSIDGKRLNKQPNQELYIEQTTYTNGTVKAIKKLKYR